MFYISVLILISGILNHCQFCSSWLFPEETVNLGVVKSKFTEKIGLDRANHLAGREVIVVDEVNSYDDEIRARIKNA